VLAGFIRVVEAPLLEAFAGPQHQPPPQPPAGFPRAGRHRPNWHAGVPESGCTVHWVNAEIDGGAHLARRVARASDDTLESFAQKIPRRRACAAAAVIARLSETLPR
jgi:phosphoribosylglycinamide formyltransferase-1